MPEATASLADFKSFAAASAPPVRADTAGVPYIAANCESRRTFSAAALAPNEPGDIPLATASLPIAMGTDPVAPAPAARRSKGDVTAEAASAAPGALPAINAAIFPEGTAAGMLLAARRSRGDVTAAAASAAPGALPEINAAKFPEGAAAAGAAPAARRSRGDVTAVAASTAPGALPAIIAGKFPVDAAAGALAPKAPPGPKSPPKAFTPVYIPTAGRTKPLTKSFTPLQGSSSGIYWEPRYSPVPPQPYCIRVAGS